LVAGYFYVKPLAVDIRPIPFEGLKQLLALYEHLHASDDPLPPAAVVEATWRELMDNPRYQYFGGYVR